MNEDQYARAVRLYQVLPGLVALMLVGIFLAVFFLTRNMLLSGFASAVPSIFLLRLWIRVAQQVDRWVCPRCKQKFSRKLFWTYPPKKCPHCGERVR